MKEEFINSKLLETVCSIAIIAGKAVMKIYNKEFEVNEKKPNDPITKADLESHFIIEQSLENLLPDTFFLSEESKSITWNKRKNWKRYWLVDPLDGTREFIKKNGEFTINIALINNYIPVLGVVLAPCFSKIYFAAHGMGSFSKTIDINNNDFSIKNCKELKVNKLEKNRKTLKIVSSRSHINNDKMTNWLNKQKKYELHYSGSSIKFCFIAEGSADIYPRFRPTSEWDTAAGHCVLKEAGGNVKDLNGDEIKYNTKETLINPEFIASYS